jgi:hypothetical protein
MPERCGVNSPARPTILDTQAGIMAEQAQQRLTFSSKEDCEVNAHNAVGNAILRVKQKIEEDSYNAHDANGNHTYHR